MRLNRFLVSGGVLLILAALLFGVAATALAQDAPPDNPVGEPPTFLLDFYNDWVGSAHAQVDAEAFNHWNAEGEVPTDCARCHSTPGYRDFLGADGTDAGVVDNAAPIGTVINCDGCHNSATMHLTAVTFPSGAEITNLGSAARCMVCHQGRESGLSVAAAIDEAGLTDNLDEVSSDLGFINIHYYAAAASLYGSEVHGGYEFPGERYQMRFDHTPGVDTCIDCHDQHTLEIRVDKCGQCHEGVSTMEDVENIRMNGSLADYDGDGNIEEGIKAELDGLRDKLYQTMQAYASEVAGTPIAYNADSYPYFFNDTNGNGTVDEDEATRDNGYSSFTGHLLEAAYNYHASIKDPGAFAHNAKYFIALMYDSISTLNTALQDPIDLSTAHRNDPGHFDATAEPFRHWDADGVVPSTCAKCHTPGGLPSLLDNGGIFNQPPSNGLSCSTCHDNIGEFTLRTVDAVDFPSGASITFGEGEAANLCLECHQGRESTVSVNAAIAKAGVGDDEVSDALSFRNPHYFAAGATLFGSEAQGAYQYDGKDYNGRNEHTRRFDQCTDCHDQHSLEVRYEKCGDCHENVDINSVADVHLIRADEDLLDRDPIDYNGNGDVTEPIEAEINSFQEALLTAIQSYATDTIGTAIAYNAAAYPYWYIDTNGNGTVDADESDSYAQWTPTLLRAAYNYQYTIKDPGAFAHNPRYILQVLYDSVEAIGGPDAVANFTRAEVVEY